MLGVSDVEYVKFIGNRTYDANTVLYIFEYSNGRRVSITQSETIALMKDGVIRPLNMRVDEHGILYRADRTYIKDYDKHIKAEVLGQAPILDWAGNVVGTQSRDVFITSVSNKIATDLKLDHVTLACKKLENSFDGRFHTLQTKVLTVLKDMVLGSIQEIDIMIITDKLEVICETLKSQILNDLVLTIYKCNLAIASHTQCKLEYTDISLDISKIKDARDYLYNNVINILYNIKEVYGASGEKDSESGREKSASNKNSRTSGEMLKAYSMKHRSKDSRVAGLITSLELACVVYEATNKEDTRYKGIVLDIITESLLNNYDDIIDDINALGDIGLRFNSVLNKTQKLFKINVGWG